KGLFQPFCPVRLTRENSCSTGASPVACDRGPGRVSCPRRPTRTSPMTRLLSAVAAVLLAAPLAAAEPIKVLIVDGQNNHNWRATTPILKKVLEDAKIFTVEVATAPDKPRPPQKPKDGGSPEAIKKYEEEQARFKLAEAEHREKFATFRPKFRDYQVV